MAWNSTYQRAKDGVHDDNRKVLEEVLPAQRVPRCVMKCRYEYDYGYEYGYKAVLPAQCVPISQIQIHHLSK